MECRNCDWYKAKNCKHQCMLLPDDMTADELELVIEICKHMVGLDYKRPYHRHGKAFYRAYRNYYGDVPEGNRLLDKLPECLFTVHRDERRATYHLTKTGLEWLRRQLYITITRK